MAKSENSSEMLRLLRGEYTCDEAIKILTDVREELTRLPFDKRNIDLDRGLHYVQCLLRKFKAIEELRK